MHEIARKTGPYLHADDDVSTVSFETGGTPRSFTLLIASAREDYTIDRSRKGLVILDNDLRNVVLDEHGKEDFESCVVDFHRVREMGWEEFSGFCRSHARYRGASPDISRGASSPDPGSRNKPAVRNRPSDAPGTGPRDLRSDAMIRAHEDPGCPYDFPRVSRDEVIREIGDAPLYKDDDGLFRLAWKLDVMDGVDITGVQGAEAVDRLRDVAWEATLDEHPEIIDEAFTGSLSPFLNASLSTWKSEDEGRYTFRIGGEDDTVVFLHTMDEAFLGFPGREEMKTALESWQGRDLRDLWKLKKTVDHDLYPDVLASRVTGIINHVRSEIEARPAPAEDVLEP